MSTLFHWRGSPDMLLTGSRVYVSGGMTGWPDNNEVEFDHAAALLRGMGLQVETPVEFGREDGETLSGDGFNADDTEYEGFLERDLARISKRHYDAVVFIKGWETSGGAGREGRRAIEEGLELYVLHYDVRYWPDGLTIRISPEEFLRRTTTKRLERGEARA